MTSDAIAGWFNNREHLTERGKKFPGANVHSILKKKLEKEDLFRRE